MEMTMTNNIDRYSNLALADRYVALKAEADRIAKLLDAAKAEIKAVGTEIVIGDLADVTVSLSERNTIDSALVKQILTVEQLKSVTKVTLVETIRIKAKVAA
jgi:hypothetical protein